MSKRNWGVFAAFAGLALCQAAYGQDKAASADQATNEQPKVTQPEAESAAVRKAIAEAAVKIEGALRDPVTENGQTHSQRDLEAQEDMAFWALIMALATVVTTGVSIYVAIIVKHTLNATAEAAVHAKTMADEAKKASQAATWAVKAGREANRISRDAQATQLRPYVYLSNTEIDIKHMLGMDLIGNTGEVRFWLKNYGHTPAKKVAINKRWYFTADPENLEEPNWGAPDFLADLPQGESTQPIVVDLFDIAEKHHALSAGDLAIVIDARVIYQMGGRGGLFHTEIRFKLTGQRYFIDPPQKTANGNSAI